MTFSYRSCSAYVNSPEVADGSPAGCRCSPGRAGGAQMTVLLVGDDWAADHHDVELVDQAGRVLARARLSEGAAGMARLHALVGEHAGAGDGEDELEVRVGIETDHGPWVMALVAAGYAVFAVNPLQAARYRDRHAVSGAKSGTGDGHILADMVRTGAPAAAGRSRHRGGAGGQGGGPRP